MAKHFYFKFGPSNCFFKTCLLVEKVGEFADLPIFFNNGWSWRLEDFQKNCGTFDAEKFQEEAKNRKYQWKEIDQIKDFVQLSQEATGENYFWTFYYPKVFVFQMEGVAKDDISNRFDQKPGENQYAKIVLAKCCRVFDLINLPVFFATLHANQRYNRCTLSQFSGAEHQYADFLMPDKLVSDKMKTEPEERLDFLSPVQFETLIFLIFHHAGIFCSTCRGGTVKDFDLKITVLPNSGLQQFFQVGSFFIQLKKENGGTPVELKDGGYTIWLGASNFEKRVFGKDWIEAQLTRFPKVNDWLRQSLDFLSY